MRVEAGTAATPAQKFRMFLFPLSCSSRISSSSFSPPFPTDKLCCSSSKGCWLEWIRSYGFSEVAFKVVGLAVHRVRVVIDVVVVVGVYCAAIYLWCAVVRSLLCTA